LKDFTANELGGLASAGALKSIGKNIDIDTVIYGNVLQTSNGMSSSISYETNPKPEYQVLNNQGCGIVPMKIITILTLSLTDAAYLARHVGHRVNLPVEVPALTVNRLCGSGFQSVISSTQEILLNEAEIALAGGTESMSQAPYALRDVRWGTRYGLDLKLEDTLAKALVDTHPKLCPMGITAENLAKQYGINRKDADDYALQSQQRWAEGNLTVALKKKYQRSVLWDSCFCFC